MSTVIRPRLGVNVDHVATVREARGTTYPEPITAAKKAELAGADQITIHLREDRRHIQDRDVRLLRETVETRLNLEMGATEEMLEIACDIEPDMVTLVPERREEQTTEGGMDVVNNAGFLTEYLDELVDCGAHLSLFIDPDPDQIAASARLGVDIVELHTGDYCEAASAFTNKNSPSEFNRDHQLKRLREAARVADSLDLVVAAGHGLDYKNVLDVAAIPQFEEFNIGHSIVSRAVLVGFERAVREMIETLEKGRKTSVGTL